MRTDRGEDTTPRSPAPVARAPRRRTHSCADARRLAPRRAAHVLFRGPFGLPPSFSLPPQPLAHPHPVNPLFFLSLCPLLCPIHAPQPQRAPCAPLSIMLSINVFFFLALASATVSLPFGKHHLFPYSEDAFSFNSLVHNARNPSYKHGYASEVEHEATSASLYHSNYRVGESRETTQFSYDFHVRPSVKYCAMNAYQASNCRREEADASKGDFCAHCSSRGDCKSGWSCKQNFCAMNDYQAGICRQNQLEAPKKDRCGHCVSRIECKSFLSCVEGFCAVNAYQAGVCRQDEADASKLDFCGHCSSRSDCKSVFACVQNYCAMNDYQAGVCRQKESDADKEDTCGHCGTPNDCKNVLSCISGYCAMNDYQAGRCAEEERDAVKKDYCDRCNSRSECKSFYACVAP